MPLFNWYNKYSVGNDDIDNQHKELFDIFNRLFDDCMSSVRSDIPTMVIDEL
jgi:hemerythrin